MLEGRIQPGRVFDRVINLDGTARWVPRDERSSVDSDLLGGVVTVRDENLLAALRQARELAGATLGTLETFLAVRGARTLALRLERAQRNAMTLAERVARHQNVTLTRFPGLASHPTHEAARRQLKGFGTIISFDVCGDRAAADAVCTGLQLIQHATSLGAAPMNFVTDCTDTSAPSASGR